MLFFNLNLNSIKFLYLVCLSSCTLSSIPISLDWEIEVLLESRDHYWCSCFGSFGLQLLNFECNYSEHLIVWMIQHWLLLYDHSGVCVCLFHTGYENSDLLKYLHLFWLSLGHQYKTTDLIIIPSSMHHSMILHFLHCQLRWVEYYSSSLHSAPKLWVYPSCFLWHQSKDFTSFSLTMNVF